MFKKSFLCNLYVKKKRSMHDIALISHCSLNKVKYWMVKYGIKARTISEAVYVKNNPQGDPFVFTKPKNKEEAVLYGFGLGLYWGEGTKADKSSVRLGNTDPQLMKKFIEFLVLIFNIRKEDLKFSLQIFNDIGKNKAVRFWMGALGIHKSQFYKVTVSPSVSTGTYKKKSENGVLILYYHNKKLRDILVNLLPL